MKLKYIGKGTLNSKGHKFVSGETYDLLKDTSDYMLETFDSAFEVVEEPKAEPKAEPEEIKVTPKTHKTKRTIAPEKE